MASKVIFINLVPFIWQELWFAVLYRHVCFGFGEQNHKNSVYVGEKNQDYIVTTVFLSLCNALKIIKEIQNNQFKAIFWITEWTYKRTSSG